MLNSLGPISTTTGSKTMDEINQRINETRGEGEINQLWREIHNNAQNAFIVTRTLAEKIDALQTAIDKLKGSNNG